MVALMTRITRDAAVTSSIGFEEQEFNELDYARQVASLYHSRHFEKVVRPDAVATAVGQWVDTKVDHGDGSRR